MVGMLGLWWQNALERIRGHMRPNVWLTAKQNESQRKHGMHNGIKETYRALRLREQLLCPGDAGCLIVSKNAASVKVPQRVVVQTQALHATRRHCQAAIQPVGHAHSLAPPTQEAAHPDMNCGAPSPRLPRHTCTGPISDHDCAEVLDVSATNLQRLDAPKHGFPVPGVPRQGCVCVP